MIIGLTGHSGSGKTTVAEYLSKSGFFHIDCDKIVHQKVYADTSLLNKIKTLFGNEYVTNGKLERKKLGSLIFSDKKAYNALMTLIKSYIESAITTEIENNTDKTILLDAPALFEYGFDKKCDKIIGVVSTKALERICLRDGISKTDAKNRLNSQFDFEFYKTHCDYFIQNDKDLQSLYKSIDKIRAQIVEDISN